MQAILDIRDNTLNLPAIHALTALVKSTHSLHTLLVDQDNVNKDNGSNGSKNKKMNMKSQLNRSRSTKSISRPSSAYPRLSASSSSSGKTKSVKAHLLSTSAYLNVHTKGNAVNKRSLSSRFPFSSDPSLSSSSSSAALLTSSSSQAQAQMMKQIRKMGSAKKDLAPYISRAQM